LLVAGSPLYIWVAAKSSTTQKKSVGQLKGAALARPGVAIGTLITPITSASSIVNLLRIFLNICHPLQCVLPKAHVFFNTYRYTGAQQKDSGSRYKHGIFTSVGQVACC